MGTNPLGQYPVRSPGRNPTLFSFSFLTADTAAPDGLVDPCSVINGAGVRTSEGLLTFTLKDRYKVLHVTCDIETTTAFMAQPGAIVDGTAAANTIGIITYKEDMLVDDTNNLTVHVQVVAYPSTS